MSLRQSIAVPTNTENSKFFLILVNVIFLQLLHYQETSNVFRQWHVENALIFAKYAGFSSTTPVNKTPTTKLHFLGT